MRCTADGTIERAEWEATFGPGSFDAWDSSHDGSIDYAEWKKIFTSKTAKLSTTVNRPRAGSKAPSRGNSRRGSTAGSPQAPIHGSYGPPR